MERDLELYYWLLLVRHFERRVERLHAKNQIVGSVYSGLGQEAIVVGCTYGLAREDVIFPLHRDLGAVLVKGVPQRLLMAQLLGKETGLSRGKEGFLHAGDLEQGVFGATSMLASTLPVACGFAFKFKVRRESRVAVAFFGEGASSRGDFHEAANFAGIHKLPVIFVCENNRYAYSTPLSATMAIDDLADRAAGYGFQGLTCNGNDLQDVLEHMERSLQRARDGAGPTLLECKTYRRLGHSDHDRASYRIKEEVPHWESRDPIRLWESYLQIKGYDLPKEKAALEERIKGEIDDAVRFAEECPEPKPEEALADLYATWTPGTPSIVAPESREQPSAEPGQEEAAPTLH